LQHHNSMATVNKDIWYGLATSFYFKIEVAGLTSSAENSFKEVSGLSLELGSEKLVEGGVNNFTWELPTQVAPSNLVLKRGVLGAKSELIGWIEDSITSDYSTPLTLRNIIVKLFDSQGNPMITWTFNNARPVKYTVSELDSTKNEIAIETMEFAYTFYKRTYAD
jgi:phage tail-like protein